MLRKDKQFRLITVAKTHYPYQMECILKKIRVLFSILMILECSGGQAFAEGSLLGPSNDSPDSTVYEKIENLYSTATLPDLGPYSMKLAPGRCFSRLTPNLPFATFLTSERSFLDVGPIAQPSVVDKIFMVRTDTAWEPARFDNSRLEALKTDDWNYLEVSLSDQQTLSYLDSDGYRLDLRQSGEYLLMKLKDHDGKILNCYYFKIN